MKRLLHSDVVSVRRVLHHTPPARREWVMTRFFADATMAHLGVLKTGLSHSL